MIGFLTENYLIKGEFSKADSVVSWCLRQNKIDEFPIIRATLLFWKANVERYLGNMPDALSFYFEAASIFQNSNEWPSLADCKIELAEFYRKKGDYSQAKKFILEASFVLKEKSEGYEYLKMKWYNRAAAIENETNNPNESIKLSLECIKLAKQQNNLYYEATSYNELGFTYKNLQKSDAAIRSYEKAEEIFWRIGAYQYAIHTMRNKAMLYAHIEYPKEIVISSFLAVEDSINNKNISYPMEDLYFLIYDEYIQQNDSSKALMYFYKYHEALIGSISKKSDLKIIEITEKYENEKIREELSDAQENLSQTKLILKQRRKENRIIYIFLCIVILFFILVIYLFIKLARTHKQLKKRNQEKDIFIQEIHHRVKNNLQFVSSLINMQMKASSDNAEIVSLNDASRRIKAMALVHEMLYKQDESTGVFIKQYLEELIYSLNDMINSESLRINFNTNIVNQEFGITTSIALGMIASELISNSIKYAFPGIEEPSIVIELKETDVPKEYKFILKDNGVGLKRNENDTQRLGMRLIDIFSRQLKGDYKIYNTNGCIYELNFKIS